jgi:hypothetical protein
MFAWQKGKVNPKMSMSALGPQESVDFFLGGSNGEWSHYALFLDD